MDDDPRYASTILPLELWQCIAAATLMCHGYKQAFGMLNMCALLRQRTVHSAAFWRTFVFERHYYGRPMYVPVHALAYCGRHHTNTDVDVAASPLRLFSSLLHGTGTGLTVQATMADWRDWPEVHAYDALRRCMHLDNIYYSTSRSLLLPASYNMRVADLFVKAQNAAAADDQDEATAPSAAAAAVARFQRIEFTERTDHALFGGWPRVALLTLFCSEVIAAPMHMQTCMALLDALEMRSCTQPDQQRLLWTLNRRMADRTPTWLGFALVACAEAGTITALEDSRSVLSALNSAARAIPVLAATARRDTAAVHDSGRGGGGGASSNSPLVAGVAASLGKPVALEQAVRQARADMRHMRVAISYIVYQFARTLLRRSVSPLRILFNILATHDPTDLPAFLRYIRPFFTAVQRRALVRTVLQANMPQPGDKGHLLRQMLGVCQYPLRDIDASLQTELLCSQLPGLGASLVPLFTRHITSAAQLDAIRQAIENVHRTTATALQNARTRHQHISVVLSDLRSARVAGVEPQSRVTATGRGAVRATRGGAAKRPIAVSSSSSSTDSASSLALAAAAADEDDVPVTQPSRRFSDSIATTTPAAKRGRRGGAASSASTTRHRRHRRRDSSSEEEDAADGSSGSEDDGSSPDVDIAQDMDL